MFRRTWLAWLVLPVGLGYVVLELLLRAPGTPGALAVADAILQAALTLLVLVGIIAVGRQLDRTSLALAAGERQLAGLLTASKDAIAVAQDGRIVMANAAANRMLRVAAGESLVGRTVLDLVDPRDRAVQAANLAGLLEVGQVDTTAARLVRDDGSTLQAEIAGVVVTFGGRPAVQLLVRDVSDREAVVRDLADSERRLRTMLDGMQLAAVFVSPDGTVRYANRATHELVGRPEGSLAGTSMFDLLEYPDEGAARASVRAAVDSGTIDPVLEIAVRVPGGRHRTIRWHLALQEPAEGAPDGGIIAIGEDITDALETGDRLRTVLASAPVGICAVDADGRVRLAQGGPFARTAHETDDESALSVEPITIEELPEPFRAPLRAALRGVATEDLVQLDGRTYEASFRPLAAAPAADGGAIGILLEVTRRADLEREGGRLATAIRQATDSVMITDLGGVITFVNPAFEQVSGYPAAEVIGRKPSVLRSGAQNRSFYAELWKTIEDGRPWTGELVNRRKDGTLYREAATITPVRDRDGQLTGYVAVKRDVTRERDLEKALDREVRERAAIVLALEGIASSDDPGAIGHAVCEAVIQLPEIDLAGVFVFDEREARTLAYSGPSDLPVAAGRVLPSSRATYLQARAALGPWAEPWRVRGVDGLYGERMAKAGVKAIAYVPLRDEAGVFGVLALGTMASVEVGSLLERLPALGALGLVASSRLASAVRREVGADEARGELANVIRDRAFRPVFQPIVDLRTGALVGYEALTRFASGTPPDVGFRRAVGIGLASELEVAAIERAVDAARSLPPRAFLSVNISAAVALSSRDLAGILAAAERPIVLEVAEHADADDHEALRALVRSLPVPARLAMDDAGGGFTNLRRVMELAPDIVKVDRTLVQDIDRDPARQALLAGLRHFASRRGISLIAEGIETSSELATLVALGVPLGQGFLLGRPASVNEVSRVPAAAVVARLGPDAGGAVPPA